jgi:predicted MFS family arabinose efflux permease
VALVSSIAAVGTGVGAVIAGPIVAQWGTHSVFLVATGVVAASSLWVFLVIPAPRRNIPGSIDVWGALLLMAWLTALLIWISQPSIGTDLPLLAVGLALLAVGAFTAWLFVERRVPHPIVNLRLMMTPTVMLSNVLAILFGWLLFANMIAVPAMVQQPESSGIGFSATVGQSALYVLPQTAMFLVVSILATFMDRWPGSRASIILGAIAACAGQTMMWMAHSTPIGTIAASATTGIGIGLIYSHLATLIVRTVPDDETAAATGMNTNVRNIGRSVGAQVSATIVALNGAVVGYPTVFTVNAGVAFFAVIVAVGIGFALGGVRRARLA